MNKVYREIEEGRDWPFLGGSQVSNARPHGKPGQARAPIAFLDGIDLRYRHKTFLEMFSAVEVSFSQLLFSSEPTIPPTTPPSVRSLVGEGM
jgi:hypothetical protein